MGGSYSIAVSAPQHKAQPRAPCWQPAAVADAASALQQRLRANEQAARLVLALPPAQREPFDTFLGTSPAYASHSEGVALMDAIVRVWAGVRGVVEQRYALARQHKDPSDIVFDGEALMAPMERAFERFREQHAAGEAAQVMAGALQGARAEVQFVRDYRFTAGKALAPLGRAMDVLVRMVALLPFVRFLASEHCSRMLAGLQRLGRAPLALTCAAVVSATGARGLLLPLPQCSGRALAGALAAARRDNAAACAAAAAPPPRGAAGEGAAWEAAAAARRAAWLAELQAVADTLPVMVTVADMVAPGAHMVLCNSAFFEATGYSAAEALGKNCRFLQGPGTAPSALARIRKAIASGSACHCALLNYRKDGSAFQNYFSLRPVWEPLPSAAAAAAAAAAGATVGEGAGGGAPQAGLLSGRAVPG